MSAESQGERTIALVLYPGLTALDLIGPLQVLAALERFAPRYRTVVVGERAEPMDTDVRVGWSPTGRSTRCGIRTPSSCRAAGGPRSAR